MSQTVLLPKTLFSENLFSCVKCAVVQPALYKQVLNATFCSIQNSGWDLSLVHCGGDKNPLNRYRL